MPRKLRIEIAEYYDVINRKKSKKKGQATLNI